MSADIATGVAAFLVGKTFRDSAAPLWHTRATLILSYVAVIPALAWISQTDLALAALVACVCRLALFVRVHILAAINHHFLEFLLLVIVLALHAAPAQMTAVIQTLVVSVWTFSVWQKVYQREFVDGFSFYVLFARRLGRWPWLRQVFGEIPAVRAPYHPLNPATLTWCRQLAWLCILAELLLPWLAWAFSGTPVALMCMLALVIPVGLISRELDFMVTNIILAVLFLSPFEVAALETAVREHAVVAAILTWTFIWPIVHAIVSRRTRFSSWRLFGWGMYATVECEVDEITPDGTLRPYRGPRRKLLSGFGECRIDAVRRLAFESAVAPTGAPDPVGIVLRKVYRFGDALVSRYTILVPTVAPVIFEVRDEPGRVAFGEYVTALAARSCGRSFTPAP